MKYEILFSSRFKKSFSKLEGYEKKMFYGKLSIFIENYKHPSLRINNIIVRHKTSRYIKKVTIRINLLLK